MTTWYQSSVTRIGTSSAEAMSGAREERVEVQRSKGERRLLEKSLKTPFLGISSPNGRLGTKRGCKSFTNRLKINGLRKLASGLVSLSKSYEKKLRVEACVVLSFQMQSLLAPL